MNKPAGRGGDIHGDRADLLRAQPRRSGDRRGIDLLARHVYAESDEAVHERPARHSCRVRGKPEFEPRRTDCLDGPDRARDEPGAVVDGAVQVEDHATNPRERARFCSTASTIL